MGRDTVLPRRVFARLSKRFHTPVFNILLCGAVGLGAIALSVETSTSPAIGAAVDIRLLTQLDRNALVVGCIWLACGVLYPTWLTRGFRRPPPEADLDDTGAFAPEGAPTA